MIEITPHTYLNASITLIILPVFVITLVLRGIKGEGVRYNSVSLFYTYLILGCCSAIVFWAQNISPLKITFAPFAIFYILSSWILVLAVTGWHIDKRRLVFVAIAHVVSIGLLVFLRGNQSFIIFSAYSLIAYSLITVFEYRLAIAMRNIGNGIIAAVGLAVILVSFFQLYALIALGDQNLAYHAHLIVTGSGFVLIGIGILASILVEEHRELIKQALIDPLTGLHNRRGMDLSSKTILSYAERKKSPVSIIAIDIDYFKSINDNFGHDVGDIVLKDVAALLLASVRTMDICCRMGGEEFILLLPDLSKEDSARQAERLRRQIEMLEIKINEESIKLTASFGVSSDSGHIDLDSLIKSADKAMYTAKSSGRNCVINA